MWPYCCHCHPSPQYVDVSVSCLGVDVSVSGCWWSEFVLDAKEVLKERMPTGGKLEGLMPRRWMMW